MCTNATPILRQKDADYVCFYCSAQYPDPADLKKHSLHCHKEQQNPMSLYVIRNRKTEFCIKLDITGLQCKLCNSNIESLELLIDHLINEHQKMIFTDVKNQILPFKFESEDIRCCICFNVFEKFRKLQEHMHTHYRNFVCEICDLGYVTRGCLIRHSAKHKLGTFKCNFCSKIYDTLRKKKSHEKRVHVHVYMTSKCGYCNERFTTNQKKDDHLAKVHGVRFHVIKCRACDKTFENKRSLTTHTKRDHLLERKFKCSECEMKFFASSELKRHMVKHTGEKNFKCDVCLKCFGHKKTLTQHMRIHLDDKRFNCQHCGQSFVQKCSWKGHMRSRHGEIVS